MRKRHSPQTYMHHIELISKLRHSHLVSALGHSFECNQDDSSVSTIFLIFEFVPNKTLRSCVSGKEIFPSQFSFSCVVVFHNMQELVHELKSVHNFPYFHL